MNRALVLLCLALASAAGAAPKRIAGNAAGHYLNVRYGYAIDYPKNFVPQGELDAGDGQTFVSKKPAGKFLVYGSHNAVEQTLTQYMEMSLEGKPAPTYKLLKKDFYVISGHDGSRVYYEKTFLRDDIFKTLRFEYKDSEQKEFDPLIAKISKSFQNLKAGF